MLVGKLELMSYESHTKKPDCGGLNGANKLRLLVPGNSRRRRREEGCCAVFKHEFVNLPPSLKSCSQTKYCWLKSITLRGILIIKHRARRRMTTPNHFKSEQHSCNKRKFVNITLYARHPRCHYTYSLSLSRYLGCPQLGVSIALKYC